jgi:uncharacterized protein YraI
MIEMMRRRVWAIRLAAAGAVIGVIGVGIAVAEDLWVSRPFVDVLAGTNSLYPVVVRAEKGTKLTVIDRDGKWVHVQVNGQDGYVMETALSSTEVQGEMFSDLKGSQSSGASAASAGKGFTADDFAAAKGLSEEPLKRLEAQVKEVVTPQGLDKFMVIGKVGDAKPVSNG